MCESGSVSGLPDSVSKTMKLSWVTGSDCITECDIRSYLISVHMSTPAIVVCNNRWHPLPTKLIEFNNKMLLAECWVARQREHTRSTA